MNNMQNVTDAEFEKWLQQASGYIERLKWYSRNTPGANMQTDKDRAAETVINAVNRCRTIIGMYETGEMLCSCEHILQTITDNLTDPKFLNALKQIKP